MSDQDRWARIESLYHAAVAMPPDARAAFLARECGDDVALRGDVESLLAQGTGEQLPGAGAAAAVADAVSRQSRIGQQIGPYVITAAVGAGGMGEVYRARDTKLDRDVALKLLSPVFAADHDRLARLEREARVLASLNHPNIAHVYGIEESDGTRAVAMELVDGETLAERVVRGTIPLKEALPIARQIADALAAAHERGIIHRDLKPANIKVRPDVTVKVLDFGLAKIVDGPSSDALNSPTISARATESGLILGTAAYMSPEQAGGKPVDRRTDLWSFGIVLMEMVTGRRVFEGDTASEALASVLKDDPRFDLLPPDTPDSVRVLLRRCLQKDPQRRLDSARDALLEIEDAATSPGRTEQPTPRRLAIAAVVSLVLLGAVATLGIVEWRASRAPATVRPPLLSITLSKNLTFIPQQGLAISPDGQTLAFSAATDQIPSLYLRRFDDWEPHALVETRGTFAFFSPDGLWVVSFVSGKLTKTPVRGGSPQVICTVPGTPQFRGGHWSPSGEIVFATWALESTLWRVPAAGGEPEVIVGSKGRNDVYFAAPMQLPGSNAVLFTMVQGGRASIVTFRRGDTEPHVLLEGGFWCQFLPTGHLVYARDGHLLAVAFDPDRLQIKGSPAVVIDDGVETTGFVGLYTVSSSGTLVYQPAGARNIRLVWRDRQGKTTPLALSPRKYGRSALSPDGRMIAAEVYDPPGVSVWVGSVDGEPLTRATFGTDDLGPTWTPDGKRILFYRGGGGHYDVFSVAADGSGQPERLIENALGVSSVSADGSVMLVDRIGATTGNDIWEYQPSRGIIRPFVQTPHIDYGGVFSPDGRWIAYFSDVSGVTEVYVQPYPGPGPRIQVSVDRGTYPKWNPNGREIFYQGRTAMFAVPVLGTTPFRAGTPARLFDTDSERPYSVAPDGNAILTTESPASITELRVIQGWFDELKSRVPIR